MRTLVPALIAIGLPAVAAADEARPRSTYEIQDLPVVPYAPSVEAAATPTIFFINKNGGTYRPGNNDARSNYSSIVDSVSTIPPWNVSTTTWNAVKACMVQMFSRWNVTITDVDPGTTTPHYEIVIAGSPEDIGMEQGVGGVSPFSGNCGVITNSIVFDFAEVWGSNVRDICETAAQEVAHSFGLDHEFMCQDPMTYLTDCGNKSFQNTAASCGEYSARQCSCGGSTQNSVAMLDTRLGLAGATIPPTTAITAPAANATVAPGFAITATATDDTSVARVELWIDGGQQGTDTTAPYSFTAPGGLADGAHAVEVRAYDSGGAVGTASITVTVNGGGGGGGGGDPDAGVGTGDDPDAGPGGGAGGDDDPSGEGDGYVAAGCAAGGGGGTGLLLLVGALIASRRAGRRSRGSRRPTAARRA